MARIRAYTVVPSLPLALARLRELAYNFWWSWNPAAMELFRRLEPDLWSDVGHNPVQFLAHVPQRKLDQAAVDKAYLAHLARVMADFDQYLSREGWFARAHPEQADVRVAYFSMEFGLHECLPIYSGGLGVLSGDHLKSASDLGVPLVAVGLAYRHGYFQQRVSSDGWQLEEYPAIDYFQLPMSLVTTPENKPLVCALPLGEETLRFQAWRVAVGRVQLYLLDSDLADNSHAARELTHRLYGGDQEVRIRQELLLGIGGIRLLRALDLKPDVLHMNEGHAAFLALEHAAQCRQEQGLSFEEARQAVTAGHVFTTHTPIPAGIDCFDQPLIEKYVTPFIETAGLSIDEFMKLGRRDVADPHEPLSMAVLAIRMSSSINGVSALHAHVSRKMWHDVWPGAARDEVPISSITNGIHTASWMAPEIAELLDRYLGPQAIEHPSESEHWQRIDDIPDLELWRTHEQRRTSLVSFARARLREQWARRGLSPTELKTADECLNPEALTVGFCRRFAPYKRGALLFRNPERLKKILSNREQPVQFIFAGKAHPREEAGKAIIKEIFQFIVRPEFRRRIVFLENYDIATARRIVQGVDVWLNNPIKPREASGTSGMKVAVNGGLNLSILDGWWPEAYDGENGWAIDEGRIYDDPTYREHVESEAVYDLLEKEIIPLFYDRSAEGLPRGWVRRMKGAMRTICPLFNTHRMVQEYASRYYAPAARRWRALSENGFARAKALALWKKDLALRWHEVHVEHIEANDNQALSVGSNIGVRARVHLGPVRPEDVAVQLYHGRVDTQGELVDGNSEEMTCSQHLENGSYWYDGQIPCSRSGQHGYAVRVVPRHPDLPLCHDTGLISWS